MLEIAATWGVGGLSASIGFFFVRSILLLVFGRLERKEAQVDLGTQRLHDGLTEEVARLSEECAKLRARADETEDELADCRRRHAESEARVKQLEATFLGMGDARQHAALIVAAEKKKDK